MKLFFATLAVASLCLSTNATAATSSLKSDNAKLSYALGLDTGTNLKRLETKIDLDAFSLGVKDSMKDAKTRLTQEEIAAVKKTFFEALQKKRTEQQAKAGAVNVKEGSAFLTKNKKEKGVITTKSGLQHLVLKKGTGAHPKATDTVKVHYKGTLLNGTEFDSSYKRNEPTSFPLNRVIPGWTEGIQLMKVGGKSRFFIPSDLAYGERGNRGIPPSSTLIFEVELIEITAAAK
ncbi:MAG: FKBP-type peptidyl-prolyl cis-trans isomerase [Mariprofundaceae bacterium]